MFRRLTSMVFLAIAGLTSPCCASTADITLGNYLLLPNTPNQTIPVYVSGGAMVSGVNFNLQVGDGGPASGGTPGPVFTKLDFVTNSIFQFDYSDPVDEGSVPQVLTEYILTANNGDVVSADGLLATVTIDTTGFFPGQAFPLLIANTLNGPTSFSDAPIPGTMTNGLITIVPEPSSIALLAAGGIVLAGWALMVAKNTRTFKRPLASHFP